MTELQLSQFMSLAGIRLTLKGLKGKKKVITFGTENYISNSLTLLIDPYSSEFWFEISHSKSGGLVLRQSTQGNIGLTIGTDITLEAYQNHNEFDNYIMVETNKAGTVYVPILRRK